VKWVPGPGGRLLRNPSVRLNVVAPIVAYWVLSKLGMSAVGALAVAAVFPAVGSVLPVTRRRRLDPVAALSLIAIVVGLIAGLVFHNGRVLLVRESLTSGTLGLVFLGSLLTSRPLLVVLRQRLSTSGSRVGHQAGRSRSARAETAVWGVALVAEATIRVGLSYLLPIGAMVTISPLLAPIVLGPVALWTLRRPARQPTAPELPAAEPLMRVEG
jgi:hypothetical protein